MPHRDLDSRRAHDRERHRRRTAARQAAGLCVRCGREQPVEGGRTCGTCRLNRRRADRARAEKRRAAGIKRVRDPAARKAEYRRAGQRAGDRIALGLCAKCGRFPHEPDRRLCADCGERQRRRDRERYARARRQGRLYGGRNVESKRRTARRRTRKRQQSRRESSLCLRCGKLPPVESGSSCAPCLENRRLADRQTYFERRAKGRCTRCGTGTFEGAPVCGPCTVLQARYEEKKRETARRRYAERRAAWICTHCGSRPSFGAARCDACAKRAWERSGQVKAPPVYPPSFTVVERGTQINHGTWDSWEDVAIALSFARLSLEDVDVLIDHAPMHPTCNMFG